jgi:hypothetical protein
VALGDCAIPCDTACMGPFRGGPLHCALRAAGWSLSHRALPRQPAKNRGAWPPLSAGGVRVCRHSLPATSVYAAATTRLLASGGLLPGSGVLLQTANPKGLASFAEAWARMRDGSDPAQDPGPLCFTNNRRTGSDAWAGQDGRSNVTEEGAVAALNAHLSTLGGGLISPSVSMWTHFLANLWPAHTLLKQSTACLPSTQLWCGTRVGVGPPPRDEPGPSTPKLIHAGRLEARVRVHSGLNPSL